MRIELENLTYEELRTIVEKMRMDKLDVYIEKSGMSTSLYATAFASPVPTLGTH